MKNDFYYCVNNDFEFVGFPISMQMRLEINNLYCINFGKSMKYFDIYIYTDRLNYIGWTHIDNSKFFKTLAEWRDKQIDKILYEK